VDATARAREDGFCMVTRSTVNYMGSDGQSVIQNYCTEEDMNSFAAGT
jgi:hypothetical protein